jgi:hypothetical protein
MNLISQILKPKSETYQKLIQELLDLKKDDPNKVREKLEDMQYPVNIINAILLEIVTKKIDFQKIKKLLDYIEDKINTKFETLESETKEKVARSFVQKIVQENKNNQDKIAEILKDLGVFFNKELSKSIDFEKTLIDYLQNNFSLSFLQMLEIKWKVIKNISDLIYCNENLVARPQAGYPSDVKVWGDFKNQEVGSFLIHQVGDYFEISYYNTWGKQVSVKIYDEYIVGPIVTDKDGNPVLDENYNIQIGEEIRDIDGINRFLSRFFNNSIKALNKDKTLEGKEIPATDQELYDDFSNFLEGYLDNYKNAKKEYGIDDFLFPMVKNRNKFCYTIQGKNTKYKIDFDREKRNWIWIRKKEKGEKGFEKISNVSKDGYISFSKELKQKYNLPEYFYKLTIAEKYRLIQFVFKQEFDVDYIFNNSKNLNSESQIILKQETEIKIKSEEQIKQQQIFELIGLDWQNSPDRVLEKSELELIINESIYKLFDKLFPDFNPKNFSQDTLNETMQMVFNFSHNSNRIHGTFASSLPVGILSFNAGLNCEMSVALLAVALEKLGERPFVCKLDNAVFNTDAKNPQIGRHYVVLLFSANGIATVLDPYNYGDSGQIRSLCIGRETFSYLDTNTYNNITTNNIGSKNDPNIQLLIFPEGVKYTLEQLQSTQTNIQKNLIQNPDSNLLGNQYEKGFYNDLILENSKV